MAWLVVPALVGAVVLFVVNSICWRVFKHHMCDFRRLPNRDAVDAALKSVPPGGFYCTTHMDDFPGGCKNPDLAKRMETGPNATIIVHAPAKMMDPKVFLYGFLWNLVEASALVCVLHGTWGTSGMMRAALGGTGSASVAGRGVKVARGDAASNSDRGGLR